MTTSTERAVDLLLTIAFLGVAAIAAYLAYKAFFAEALMFSFAMILAALFAMLFGVIYLQEILVRRWAEQRMLEMQKEKEENR